MNENQTILGLRKRTVIWIVLIALFLILLFLIVFFLMRRKPDLSSFKEGVYYVAQNPKGDVVLYLDDVSSTMVSGKWYREGGEVAMPHRFEAKSRCLRRNVLRSDSLVIKVGALPGGDTLVLDLLMDGDWQNLRFIPWQQPPLMEVHRDYLYHESIFPVAVESDIVYAHAKGYWTSYPEPYDDCNDYLSIVMDKMNLDDLTLKDCALTMDVYSPVTEGKTRRPLLMLIHGGAFFNGDKKAAGYEEWGKYFASRGYVVASINYRIGFAPLGKNHMDRAGYRAVQDAHAAMCFLLSHPERFPIDPNRLFVGGSSAGGITALNLAFMKDEDRPASSYSNKVHEANQIPIVHYLIPDNENLDLEDMGDINAVVGEKDDVPFTINTVVNMWGAVHDIGMIDGYDDIAVLSFHGDADSVVAYGYDYPFTKIKTPVKDFISKVRKPIMDGSSWFSRAADDLLFEAENSLKPVNEFMSNEMYGSKCIHEKALSKGLKSELHTKRGGGHGLHADCGVLTDYYEVITDTTTRFLYLRMFPRPDLNPSFAGRQQWFSLDNAGEVQTCQWEALGGLVLEAEPDKARVLFFSDAPEHDLKISGQEKNGQSYNETYSIN